ncbi:sensor histidine kinase [Geomonas sp. Red69]|uniref:sensor histidine kinase n=1 Tax=Geomonas diazotrophica TaxID=2843197 RepID=UPI001C1171CF|nr:ATP-binding protein [Geomonas diazotrophica]MBU5637524.1 sensor histidine kinase [Geomonas diazotrophica]
MEVPKSRGEREAGTRKSPGSGENRAAQRKGAEPAQQQAARRPAPSADDCEARLAQAEQELRRVNEELARQKGNAENLGRELETFSYSVSHDLRAPLRHLIGFSNALLEDYGEALEPTAHSYLDCIVRAGRKMEGLVDALLALSRIGRQDMTLLNLDLSQMAKSYALCIKEGAPGRKVNFMIPEHLPAHGDAVLLRTALEHLLENAWKFTGKKESATIELGSKEEGGELVYFVRDDGAGFDMRFSDRLFGPFQRMHREEEFPGLGIGLAIVQRIINRHGGRIWAEAEVNAGATFYFTLGS